MKYFCFFICSLHGWRAYVRSTAWVAGLGEVRCLVGGLGFGSAFSRRAVWGLVLSRRAGWFSPVGGAYFDKGEIK